MGSERGEEGYIRMQRNVEAKEAHCIVELYLQNQSLQPTICILLVNSAYKTILNNLDV